jgi:hypothetical protein
MDNVNIREKFPHVYDGFVEVQALSESEQEIFETSRLEYLQLVANQWVLTSILEGIEQYESMFGILADPQDSIQLRRERIINTLSNSPPFTFRYLKSRLDSFLGEGTYILTLLPNQYKLEFLVHVGEYGKLDELIKIIIEIMPSNLIRVVQNDILCYNTTEESSAIGLGFAMCYLLSSDFNTSYVANALNSLASVAVPAQIALTTMDFNRTETANQSKYIGNSASLNTIYTLN